MTDFESVLVSTEWIAEHLHDSQVRIVDIRGRVLPANAPPPQYFSHRSDYDQRHIPGAVFADWTHDITDPDSPYHAQVAKPERYAAFMSSIGVSDETLVIAYDDFGNALAARLWWSLHYYGHTRVAVLDGGWGRWTAEGRPTTAEIPVVQPGQFIARPQPNWYRSGDQVLAALHSVPLDKLVDMRSKPEFDGEYARARRSGHIPGAVNQPRAELVQPDGRLLPPADLRAKFRAIGVDDTADQVVFYCSAGVAASLGLLALRAADINVPAAVYDASWREWGNDDGKPIA